VAEFPSIDALATAIAGRPPDSLVGVRAAVMLCLRDRGRGTEVVIGRRQERSDDPWSGQMSLPGGRLDHPDEPALAAAVRETAEEVGFDPLAHGELLGPLETVHGGARQVFVATFAAQITSDIEPTPSIELPATWWMPFSECEEREVHVPEVPYVVPAFTGQGGDGRPFVVWGMTYNVLTSARALADGRNGNAQLSTET
jgi:8-oxo-dGTP pyrophosphatase MutT (NUDIX family)